MRLFLSALVTALLAPFAAQAHSPSSCPAPEPAPMSWQYVGATATAFDGGQGLFTYNLACNAAHAGSRMCTSEEVMNTINPPIVGSPGEAAWVRPLYQPGGRVDLALVDASGQLATGACEGWSVTGGSGLTIDLDDGAFHRNSCASARRITCCALVP